jgi:(2R)-3-sulfolactate dehydrogenase (NADP+)
VGLLVEIMAAALSGANLGTEASPFSGTSGGPPATGQGFIAIEPDGLSGGAFPGKIAALCKSITEQEGARLPGARRVGNRLRNERGGIDVDRELVEKLRGLAGA